MRCNGQNHVEGTMYTMDSFVEVSVPAGTHKKKSKK